jgi:ABC-type transporter Mla MlaB component
MWDVSEGDGVTVIRGAGELSRAELEVIAALAARARHDGRRVVIDLSRVSHLHYAGAALLKGVHGVRAAGASRYVRDLVRVGGAGAAVEFHSDVEEAVRAA